MREREREGREGKGKEGEKRGGEKRKEGRKQIRKERKRNGGRERKEEKRKEKGKGKRRQKRREKIPLETTRPLILSHPSSATRGPYINSQVTACSRARQDQHKVVRSCPGLQEPSTLAVNPFISIIQFSQLKCLFQGT